MKCNNCNILLDNIKTCSQCKSVYYCSYECQYDDWRNGHKQKCFDMNKLKNIIKKCDKAGLIRHINGNTLDNRRQNLQRVTALDSLKNKDWTVDACLHLTDEEFDVWFKARS